MNYTNLIDYATDIKRDYKDFKKVLKKCFDQYGLLETKKSKKETH